MHHRYLYFLSVLSLLPLSQCCNSFDRVIAEVTPKNGEVFNKSIKGCVSRDSTNISGEILTIKIIDQPVSRLRVGAVEYMDNLRTIEFIKCNIHTIQPRAFRNVSRLEKIFIQNGALENVSKGIFVNMPGLKKISLAHNKITTMENGSFDIPTLRILHLHYNKLTKWNKHWFSSFENLVEIDFRENLISELPPHAFENLNNLVKIIFDCNVITTVGINAFKGLHNLKHLGLTYNRLTEIDVSWFPNRISLSKLAVNANKLNYLSLKVLEKIRPEQVHLDGNPWKCECWYDILGWVHNNTGSIVTTDYCINENAPVCVSEENRNGCDESVDQSLTSKYFNEVAKSYGDIDSVKNLKCYCFD